MKAKNTVLKRLVLVALLLSPIMQGCGTDPGAQPAQPAPAGGGCGAPPAGGGGCTPPPGGGGCSPAGGGCTPGGGGCTPGGGGCSPVARITADIGTAQTPPPTTASAPAPRYYAPAGGEQAVRQYAVADRL